MIWIILIFKFFIFSGGSIDYNYREENVPGQAPFDFWRKGLCQKKAFRMPGRRMPHLFFSG